jgi:hypothetical protein
MRGSSGRVPSSGGMLDSQVRERSPSPAERAPARPGRRRWARVASLLAAGALLGAVLGFLISDHVDQDRHFDRLHASLSKTRDDASAVAANLTALRHAIAVIRSEVTRDSATWSQDTEELKAAYAALVLTQADVSQQSTLIESLHTCLGGVRQALNSLAINDHVGAISSLDSVASSCSTASGN